jgi:Uma2 family endonuclease
MMFHLSAHDFIERYGLTQFELVDGIVRRYQTPGAAHGRILARLSKCVGDIIAERDLGHAASYDGWLQTSTDPDTIRKADLSLFDPGRLLDNTFPAGLLPVVPDLTVEVCVPPARWLDRFNKMVEYLKVGVRVVVLVHEPAAGLAVYRADAAPQLHHRGDALTIPDVLPGFSVPVSRLFE